MASIVIVYGVLLAILGFALQQIAPALAKVTFITSLTGGGLCVLWGLAALADYKRRTWAVLTLIVVSFVVLTQVVQAWSATASESSGLTGAALLTLLLLLTVGMLFYLLHGERTPEFYTTGTDRRGGPGLPPE